MSSEADDKIEFTAQEVKLVIQRMLDDPSAKIVDYILENYSEDRVGYSAYHKNLKITVQRKSGDTESFNLFVKAISDRYGPENLEDIMRIFKKEFAFYRTIFDQLMEGYGDEDWAATCYLVKEDVLVMKNLKHEGFRMLEPFFDEDDVLKAGLTTIAQFHSCSIVTEARLQHLSKRPVTLNEMYADNLQEIVYITDGAGTQWFLASAKTAARIAKTFGHDYEKTLNAFDKMYDLVKPSQVHRNIICHGDLWKNNMMFDDSKPRPKCRLVDFQIIRYAPLVLDILQFLYLNTTRTYRKKSERSYIEFYYETLKNTINNNAKVDWTRHLRVPTFDEVYKAYEDLRFYGAATAALYLPIILLDPNTSTELTKDEQGLQDFIYGDRMSLTLNYMEKNELYKFKITEAINEVVEML